MSGSGNGTVKSPTAPPNLQVPISCTATGGTYCKATFYEGTVVTLTANPANGTVFGGWTGACSGRTPSCQVTMTDVETVGATFIAAVGMVVWPCNGMPLNSAIPVVPVINSANVSAGTLTMTGLAPTSTNDAYVASGWPYLNYDLSKYLEFSVTAAAGHTIAYQFVNFTPTDPAGGGFTWEIRSSVDGFATSLGSGNVVAGADGSQGLAGVGLGSSIGELGGTVTFRFYALDRTGTSSTLGFSGSTGGGGSDLFVSGVVF